MHQKTLNSTPRRQVRQSLEKKLRPRFFYEDHGQCMTGASGSGSRASHDLRVRAVSGMRSFVEDQSEGNGSRRPPMKIRVFLAIIPLFLIAAFLSAHVAIRLPYIENWPFTWVIYAGVFGATGIALVIRLQAKKITPVPSSFRLACLVLLLYMLMFSSFFCLAVRSFIERLHAYSFEYGEVLQKFRSSNHNYPAMQILTEDGRSIYLDLPGQEEIWQNVNVGDHLAKPFGKDTLVPAIQGSGDP